MLAFLLAFRFGVVQTGFCQGGTGPQTNGEMTMYAIDSENGNELCAGLSPESYARQVAQRKAAELGQPVYLYRMGQESSKVEEFAPEADDDSEAA